MNAVTSPSLVSKIQKAIWDAAGGLETIGCEIARGDTDPTACSSRQCRLTDSQFRIPQPCPAPINYLANGNRSTTLKTSHGTLIGTCLANLASYCHHSPPFQPFNGCNFHDLRWLAEAKSGLHGAKFSNGQYRGFGMAAPDAERPPDFPGLSFLFSPWTDFCLLCWDYYDCLKKKNGNLPEPGNPILIFGRDYYPLSHECVEANEDWGLNRMFCCNSSKPIFWGHYGILTHSTKCTDPEYV